MIGNSGLEFLGIFPGSVNGQINYDESQVVAFPVDPELEQGAIVTFANSPNEV